MKICPRCSELYPDELHSCRKDGSELRPVLDPLIGKTVAGRYRLISRLGTGGMSSVYLARHVMIDRLVAVKTLRRDLARDPIQRDRFIREARAVNRINHDNIVDISDFGESEDGLVYLVMEYVPGDSLLKAMEKAPFPTARALHIAEQIAIALSRAHQMGVVHRDLKPENILLQDRKDCRDFVKILDFGIAKILDAPSLTGSQQIFGTPGYIAPEYIQSTHIDGRADIYSLGVILYEMVTAALPFDYQYPGDLLVKHVTEAPIPPTQRRGAVEPATEALILRCLQKNPAERFRDAFHFLEALRAARERLGPPEEWGAIGSKTQTPPIAPRRQEALRARAAHETPTFGGATEVDALASGESRPSGRAHRPPMPTMDYTRPTIPDAPESHLGLDIDVEIELSKAPSEAPPKVFDAGLHGLLGEVRWQARFSALRHALDEIEIERESPAPAEIAQAMARASHRLEALLDGIAGMEPRQARIEELQERARDFRSTLGRAVDELGRKLSSARGEFESAVGKRNELRAQREATRMLHRQKGQAGEGLETQGPGRPETDRDAMGEADARLWELAAVEAELRTRAVRCDEIEAQLADLRTQLDRENEAIEGELETLVTQAEFELGRLDEVSRSLGEPLAQAESFIRRWWEENPVDRGD